MNKRRTLLVGSLLVSVSCGGTDGPMGPTFCGSGADTATFEDASLEAAVRAALPVGPEETLVCDLVVGLTYLDASNAGIASLEGIQNLTDLETLDLDLNLIADIVPLSALTALGSLEIHSNSISDISPLGGLTGLSFLRLQQNSITDVSPLSRLTNLILLGLDRNLITDVSALRELTGLTVLLLEHNAGLSDIRPLLDNADAGGLGGGDQVYLRSTNVDCEDVALLAAAGVDVTSDCP